ncbi:hypothetical protein [sulfur-oxidizing endosymbiont of Gigantopelta aegis]|uniref:hypothetical protein n=1 Tax=sulfur-oxidizing endosymbiont of Gigantopelta aegis TaxID=2794934 RepID=UPI0018DD1476|nr:hypothetical protein [sulfur-oxidizing endosymbiont of Gigantopelta aegis]
MADKIKQIVLSAIHNMGELEENQALLNPNEDLRLFGGVGVLDSLGIVMLIAEIEDQIQEELAQSITLADDRAMSQKTSPFRSVKSLINYIENLLAES